MLVMVDYQYAYIANHIDSWGMWSSYTPHLSQSISEAIDKYGPPFLCIEYDSHPHFGISPTVDLVLDQLPKEHTERRPKFGCDGSRIIYDWWCEKNKPSHIGIMGGYIEQCLYLTVEGFSEMTMGHPVTIDVPFDACFAFRPYSEIIKIFSLYSKMTNVNCYGDRYLAFCREKMERSNVATAK